MLAGFIALTIAFAGSHAAPLGAVHEHGAYSFVTAPSLHPPEIRSTQRAPTAELAPGYIFTANFYDLNEPPIVGQSGPLILDRRLQPVWFQPVPEKPRRRQPQPADLRRQAGARLVAGRCHEHGRDRNRRVRGGQPALPEVARLKATDGWVLTLHELAIDGDDAWVTANKNIPMNLSKYGGAYNGALIDSAVQEYDLKTGKLLPAGTRSTRPHCAFQRAVFDERFAECRAFAAELNSAGVFTSAIRGDVAKLWYDDLRARLSESRVPIAGLTDRVTLFCLEELARDVGMRVIFRADHIMDQNWTKAGMSSTLPLGRHRWSTSHATCGRKQDSGAPWLCCSASSI